MVQLLKELQFLTPDTGTGRFFDSLSESAARLDGAHGDKPGGSFFHYLWPACQWGRYDAYGLWLRA